MIRLWPIVHFWFCISFFHLVCLAQTETSIVVEATLTVTGTSTASASGTATATIERIGSEDAGRKLNLIGVLERFKSNMCDGRPEEGQTPGTCSKSTSLIFVGDKIRIRHRTVEVALMAFD